MEIERHVEFGHCCPKRSKFREIEVHSGFGHLSLSEAIDHRALKAQFGHAACELARRFPAADVSPGTTKDERLARKVAGHIEKPKGDLDIALDLRGTPFQQKVWQALLAIPAGKTSSYRDIARKVGSPRAIRAVGNACGSNNLALAVPCHRVLYSNGALSGGYHWGNDRQAALLAREGVKNVKQAQP